MLKVDSKANKNVGLGRGLSHLLGDDVESGITEININNIIPNVHQPRKNFDILALEELSGSIQEHGLLQPIVVRKIENDRYEIIAGERRWRASKMANLKRMPVIIKDVDNKESLELAIVENLQRLDVSPVEAAHSYKKLMDEYGFTQEKLAKRLGKSRSAIANTLRIINLPDEVQKNLLENNISEGHARAILSVPDENMQLRLLKDIIKEKLSVRDTETKAKRITADRGNIEKYAKLVEPAVEEKPLLYAKIEEALSMKLGLPVKIQYGANAGKLYIEYYSEDNLQHLLNMLDVTID